jgi:hypothetical protein
VYTPSSLHRKMSAQFHSSCALSVYGYLSRTLPARYLCRKSPPSRYIRRTRSVHYYLHRTLPTRYLCRKTPDSCYLCRTMPIHRYLHRNMSALLSLQDHVLMIMLPLHIAIRQTPRLSVRTYMHHATDSLKLHICSVCMHYAVDLLSLPLTHSTCILTTPPVNLVLGQWKYTIQ